MKLAAGTRIDSCGSQNRAVASYPPALPNWARSDWTPEARWDLRCSRASEMGSSSAMSAMAPWNVYASPGSPSKAFRTLSLTCQTPTGAQ